MYEHDSAFLAWGNETLKSELYVSSDDLQQLDPSLFEEKEEAEQSDSNEETA